MTCGALARSRNGRGHKFSVNTQSGRLARAGAAGAHRVCRRERMPLALLAAAAAAASPRSTAAGAKPNVVTFLIDDMDLERVPFYPKLDDGAAWQLNVHLSTGGCRMGETTARTVRRTWKAWEEGRALLGRARPRLGLHALPLLPDWPAAVVVAILFRHAPWQVDGAGGRLVEHVDRGGAGGSADDMLPCCGPGVPRPCVPSTHMFGCVRRSKTLGSMLQASANYFTGFVGKWHLSSMPYQLNGFRSGKEATSVSRHRRYRRRRRTAAATVFGARETHFAPLIRRTGFNYTGGLSVGNVLTGRARRGRAQHGLGGAGRPGVPRPRRLPRRRRPRGRLLPPPLHDPHPLARPDRGVCADPRMSPGGLLDSAPTALRRARPSSRAPARRRPARAPSTTPPTRCGSTTSSARCLASCAAWATRRTRSSSCWLTTSASARGRSTMASARRWCCSSRRACRAARRCPRRPSSAPSTSCRLSSTRPASSPTRRTHPTTPPRYRTTRGGATTAGATFPASRAPPRERRRSRLLRRRGGATSSTRSWRGGDGQAPARVAARRAAPARGVLRDAGGRVKGARRDAVACEYERLRTAGPTMAEGFTHARHCVCARATTR